MKKRQEHDDQLDVLARALGKPPLQPKLPYPEQVHAHLGQAILTLALKPGQPLSEAALSKAFGISRSPIREALKMLEKERLVVVYPQAGTLVAPISLQLVEQGSFLRYAIEHANHMELVGQLSRAQRSALQDSLDAQKTALARDDYAEFFQQDEGMHRLLFAMRGREHVWPILQSHKQHVNRARLLLVSEPGHASTPRAYAEHGRLVRALIKGDAARLDSELREHIMKLRDHILAFARENPHAFALDTTS